MPALTKALNNMKSFRVMKIIVKYQAEKKLQEATWIFIVNHLATRDEKNELMKTF